MDNKSTTKRMIGAVVLVLIAALLLAWLLKGKNRPAEQKDLIAEQTQESTPILGFPGVKEENAQNGESLAAASTATTDPAVQPAGANQEYAIGSTNAGAGTPTSAGGTTATTDPAAQQQAQSVLGAQDPNASMPIADPNSTNTPAGAGAGTTAANEQGAGAGVVAAATGAAAGAVEAGKQAVQGVTSQMQSDTTGFQVRDPKKGEVREVVENGQKQPGVGSMGANATVAAGNNGKAASGEAAKTAGGNETAKVAASGSSAGANKLAAGSNNSAGNASNKDRPAVSSGELKPENPRLVNERPVPAPVAQPRNTNTASATRPATVERATTTAARPVEKPVPTITAASSSASGYVIQVLATSDKAKADGIKSTMSGEGYPVFVASAKVDGKTVYRVRVGTYPGKGDAAAVQARMKARYAQNQYVQNSFVTKN
ncbi:SPOR domain-containing protein [uncultured Thiothrix sp.]|uniref:SPOR domain-containing protein n=1 Tax=uncultured Thiothrix sp. TaxID=223185 RepID=UPI002609A885|nr:SPOR domain-containing protein [uncultured Thiothrix sp.]